MTTTPSSRHPERPEAERDRDRAWAHLLEFRGGVRRLLGHDSSRRLVEIARAYDRVCRRAQGILQPDATETDILASLLVIRILREKLDHDELQLISLARTKKITWARIATALEMRSRQSAERRHLQLSRAYLRPDGTLPRTQSERVEHAREHRSRRAERQWALRHAASIRHLAARLTAVEDLQQRADQSAEARIIAAIQQHSREPGTRDPAQPLSLAWPRALKECLAEDEQFRSTPPAPCDGESTEETEELDWRRQQQEADIVHRLLGLISHAAIRRNIDLSDHPDLLGAITALHDECQLQTKGRG
ncbi:hypothetical protein AB0K09_29765 [Streptomyces sp. NPDC049577]|uniref:hypothetical protein n=1 Tax=Streptomyces sp. NPDC049577 TaxID=3155153 RepID=UPI003415327E